MVLGGIKLHLNKSCNVLYEAQFRIMKKLVTEFVKIGQSGPTADGRNIEAAWLQDAAETYDPAKYTALIWPDHFSGAMPERLWN